VNADLLKLSLEIAVPIWIDQLRNSTFEERAARARRCAEVVGPKGDIILYRSQTKGETTEAFNRLAEGIACAAYQPGGIKVFGLRFEAHQGPTREELAEEFWGGHTCPDAPCALCVTLARQERLIDGSPSPEEGS
jgi:hypothetical protein